MGFTEIHALGAVSEKGIHGGTFISPRRTYEVMVYVYRC